MAATFHFRYSQLLGLLAGLVATLVLQGFSPVVAGWDKPWFDSLLQIRSSAPPDPPDPYLVLVAYDDQARANRHGAPVPIAELVSAIRKLHDAGTGPVVLNFVFGSPMSVAELDTLAQAVQGHGQVFLPKVPLPRGGWLQAPRTLAASARAEFEDTIPMDPDGRLRRWPVSNDATSQVFGEWTLSKALEPRVVNLVDPAFLCRPGWTTIRWDDLLSAQGTSKNALKDCVVVVADISAAGKDVIQTPWGLVTGAELILWKLQTALSDRPHLRSAPDELAWGFVVLPWFIVSFFLLLLRKRSVLVVGLLVEAAWMAGAAGLMVLDGLWLPWGSLAMPGAIVLLFEAMRLLMHRHRQRHLALIRDQRARARSALLASMGGLFHQMAGRAGLGVHLARRGVPGEKQLTALLEGLHAQARQGLALMKPGDPGPASTSLPLIVGRLVDQQRLERPNSRVETSNIDILAPLPLDPLEAELALEVFLVNAIEASNTATLKGERTSNHKSRLTIEDQGTGMPLLFGRPRILSGVSTKAGGHGFGLFWALEVLEEAGIRARFQSGPGGTKVQLEWPS